MYKSMREKKKVNPLLAKTGSFFLNLCRMLLGLVFIFSGFVKAIDPLGSSYKFEDYFNAFGGVFASFTSIAFPAAIFLSTLELFIGLNLFFRIYVRFSSVLALLFMLVMTPLTLYIALYNPVSDCGCFGEALILDNWTTFYKNVALLVMVLLVLIFNKRFHPLFLPTVEKVAVVLFVGAGVGLSVYCYAHLPLIDFLPYKTGVNIPSAMVVPEGAKSDKYETTFIYEKNGQQKEFTLENYPKGDSTWVFVDQKSTLISEGDKALIHDFSIVDAQFNDITEKVLYNEGYTYLLIMYDLAKTSEEGARKSEDMYQIAKTSGIGFYALTASSDSDVKNFMKKTGVTYPFCKTDPTTLKTIVRGNPGLILIKNGTIQGKWNWRDFE